MTRRSLIASIAVVMLLLALTAGAAMAARPVFVFQTLLTGEAEVPGPGDADAIGHATVIVRPGSDQVCWVVAWNRIDGTVVAAHIHGPADTATAVPPVVTFFQGVPHDRTDSDRGCTVSEAWADAIVEEPSQFYVNVHSVPDHGPGAIRGQLGG